MKGYLASQSEKNSLNNVPAFVVILLATSSRLIPHWPNFTAVGAIALFSGAVFGFNLRSILTVFLSLFITDLILGFHSTMIAVYGAMALIVLIGSWGLGSNKVASVEQSQSADFSIKKLTSLIGFSLFSSVVFFAITNFAVWALDHMYSQDIKGLLTAYVMGLPFLPQQILGDLFYAGVIFYGYQLVVRIYPFTHSVES